MDTKLPCFDELQAMDEQSLEQLRSKLEGEIIANAHSQTSADNLKKMQHKLAIIRHSAESPQESCLKITRLIVGELNSLNGQLLKITRILQPHKQQNPDHQCQVISFSNVKRDKPN